MEEIIYIASPDSQQIHVWKINQKNESFNLIQILKTSGRVHPIIIHPNKKNLYAGVRPFNKIIHFHIEKNGYLNTIEEFTLFSSSTHLSIDKIGKTLYSVSYKENILNIIKLDDFGNFISILQTLTGLMGCHSSQIEIPQKRLWIPCLKEDCIRLYNINKQGILDENSIQKIITKKNSGPRHMVFHHSYDYAYVINEINSTINVIKIYPSNDVIGFSLPKIIQTINIFPNHNDKNNIFHYWGSDIHITPDNRWIYCTERSANIISCLKILNDNNGQLEFKDYQATEIQPRGFSIDSQGKYLIVAGQKSNFVSVYKINKKNGKLIYISRFQAGEGPISVTTLNLN